jgi:uncharacterized protein (UPF0147 family)
MSQISLPSNFDAREYPTTTHDPLVAWSTERAPQPALTPVVEARGEKAARTRAQEHSRELMALLDDVVLDSATRQPVRQCMQAILDDLMPDANQQESSELHNAVKIAVYRRTVEEAQARAGDAECRQAGDTR